VIVVDASAMVDVLVDEPVNDDLLRAINDNELHAPALLDFEIASALRGHYLGRRLTARRLDVAVDDYRAMSVKRHHMFAVLKPMLALRDSFTVYDAAYIVLAQALDAPLVTADAKLLEARRLGVDVQVFGPTSR
jgi:predicted nucleic acid-binding protein